MISGVFLAGVESAALTATVSSRIKAKPLAKRLGKVAAISKPDLVGHLDYAHITRCQKLTGAR